RAGPARAGPARAGPARAGPARARARLGHVRSDIARARDLTGDVAIRRRPDRRGFPRQIAAPRMILRVQLQQVTARRSSYTDSTMIEARGVCRLIATPGRCAGMG